jgi:MscS family membrane protein
MNNKEFLNKFSKRIKQYNKSINKIILFFGIILVIFVGVILLDNYEIVIISKVIINILKTIAIIITSYFIASIFIRLTSSWALKLIEEGHIEQRIIVSKLYSAVIYFLATLFVLWKMGVSIQNIALMSGFFATGLAFALREVLLSFFVWLILLIKKPFRIEDNIKIGDDEGIVKHIGIFYVLINNNPKNETNYIKVPNKQFIEKSIYNYGKKEVPIKIVYNIDSNIKDISKKIDSLVKTLEFANIYKKPYLDVIDGKLYLIMYISCSYNKREETRTKIITEIISIFK